MTNNEPYRMVLKCHFCDLLPGGDAEVAMLAEHFTAEHDDVIEHDEDGKPKLVMDMLPMHLPCEALARPLGEPPDTAWRCSQCRALFDVEKSLS